MAHLASVPKWTKEQAAEMSRKGLAARRLAGFNRDREAERIAEHIAQPANAARTRCARLWLTIEALDARIARLAVQEGPASAQLAKLIAATRELQKQALELDAGNSSGNGRVGHPPPQPQADLPPPTPTNANQAGN